MTKEAYMALYEKYIAGKCSAAEIQLLEEYCDAFELTDTPWNEASMGNQEAAKQRIQRRLFRQMKHSRFRWYGYAAAAFLALGLTVLIGLYLPSAFTGHPAAQQAAITPGGNKALLTLEDGTQVPLDQIDLSELAQRGQAAIRELDTGLLVYGATATPQTADQFHTISTPRGGQFQVKLADGTTVWLNAESSIQFPLAFTAGERRVEVSGEVFFDVANRADKPFVVQCDGQTVRVLGTSFVVTSYADENVARTALLSGKVQVRIDAQEYRLEPGQRTVYHKADNRVDKEAFDVEEALAWRNGLFLFRAEPVESVMRKIARWYDVDVVYQGDMRGKQFSGSVSRYDEIQDVLDMLTLTGTVRFKVEGRRVIVME